jgi:predicted nucleic acid-binding protein
MKSVYCDASVLVPLFVLDKFNERADAYFSGHQAPLIVSDFAAAEFSSAISRRVRMNILSKDEAWEAFGEFDRWRSERPLRLETTAGDMAAADRFVRRLDLGLRTPDALHIALAERAGAVLATFDEAMANSATLLRLEVAST